MLTDVLLVVDGMLLAELVLQKQGILQVVLNSYWPSMDGQLLSNCLKVTFCDVLNGSLW